MADRVNNFDSKRHFSPDFKDTDESIWQNCQERYNLLVSLQEEITATSQSKCWLDLAKIATSWCVIERSSLHAGVFNDTNSGCLGNGTALVNWTLCLPKCFHHYVACVVYQFSDK